MRRQPNGIRFEEAKRVLEDKGYTLARSKGSHNHFINSSGNVITVAARSPSIKAVYVKDILSKI